MKIYKYENDNLAAYAKKYVWLIAGCSELIYGDEAKEISDDLKNSADDLYAYANNCLDGIYEKSIMSIELSMDEEQLIYDVMSKDCSARVLLETGVVLNDDISKLIKCLDGVLKNEDVIRFLKDASENGCAIILS